MSPQTPADDRRRVCAVEVGTSLVLLSAGGAIAAFTAIRVAGFVLVMFGFTALLHGLAVCLGLISLGPPPGG